MTVAENELAPGYVSKEERYGWSTPGPMGKFKHINKRLLDIDTRYQRREVSSAKTLKIAREFDWKLFGTLAVVQRPNGSYYVYDGGHRLRASLKRSDIEEVPCLVFFVDDVVVEAEVYERGNQDVTYLSAVDKYNSALFRGDPNAVRANQIIGKHGYRVAKSNEAYGFQAIKILRDMIQKDDELAEKCFDLSVALAENGEQIPSSILRALFYLSNAVDGDIFSGKWRKKISQYSISSISHAIRQEKHIMGMGGARIEAKAILDLLNKKAKHRLHFKHEES